MKFIRITADNDDAVRELCEGYRAYACKEGPDNEKNCRKIHYHILLDSDLSDNGLRKQIYKYFGIAKVDQGQKSTAFTAVKDTPGVCRYISKGTETTKPEIIINTMNVNVDEHYESYWDVFASLKEEGKKVKELAKSRTQEYLDYFANTFGADNKCTRRLLTLGKICDIMVMWYKEKDYMLPTKWQGAQLIRTCYVKYTEDKLMHLNMRMYYDASDAYVG